MEHTFMTIHNLTPDCTILFASESIIDILGWPSDHVRGRAVFDFFHPEELPFARSVHSRGLLLDKAASLHYVRILAANGQWVSCECCFTVVHDVLVACTSLYRRGEKSERRAIEGAQIRRLFSSSPRDPRYHMLEHLSPKFKIAPVGREPRAALILNRFTRNLTIMFATNAVASVLGLTPDQLKDKSFYRCIQERCLPDALKCLESAKANDSIAYLRFWSRDPREADDFENDDEDGRGEESMGGGSSTSDSDDGGTSLDHRIDMDAHEHSGPAIKREEDDDADMQLLPTASGANSGQGSSRTGAESSLSATQPDNETPLTQNSPASAAGEGQAYHRPRRPRRRGPLPSLELEAVVSCTSDGLVVILRRARPAVPPAHPPLALAAPREFRNGLFAAPWAPQPVRAHEPPERRPRRARGAPQRPQPPPQQRAAAAAAATAAAAAAAGGPPEDLLMRSIRDVAVFAWALVGINGTLAAYAHGRARGEAAPPGGIPVWNPGAPPHCAPPHNQAEARWAAYDQNIGQSKGRGRGKAKASPQGEDPSAASYAGRELPRPVFGMPSYLHTTSTSTYQSSGRGYVLPPQQGQQSGDVRGHADAACAPEPWRDEQQVRAAPFPVPTDPPGTLGSMAYDDGWSAGR